MECRVNITKKGLLRLTVNQTEKLLEMFSAGDFLKIEIDTDRNFNKSSDYQGEY